MSHPGVVGLQEARSDSCSPPQFHGVQGESSYTDVVRIGKPSARNLLVFTSGTHGVEGYCGSGIQVGLLEQGWFADLGDDIAVLMIHAVNPPGFSHNRRANEDNIDFNRNLHDFSQLVPENEHYAVLHSAILPEEWDGRTKSHPDEVLKRFATDHGQDALRADNWLSPKGDVANDQGQLIKRQVRDTFYCDAECDAMVYRPLADIGGSVSAEHGIGTEKMPWLSLSRTPQEIDMMRLLKQSLDPKGILNPERVI